MEFFYTYYRWGMDWSHFQLRAQWNAGWRFFYGIDKHRTVWWLVIGPIEISAHPWRRGLYWFQRRGIQAFWAQREGYWV